MVQQCYRPGIASNNWPSKQFLRHIISIHFCLDLIESETVRRQTVEGPSRVGIMAKPQSDDAINRPGRRVLGVDANVGGRRSSPSV